MKLDYTDTALDLDLEDPLEAVLAIAQRVNAAEIARDASELADRLLAARSGVAVVGTRTDTRAFVNAWIGRSTIQTDMRCDSLVITCGRNAHAVVQVSDNEHHHVELASLEGYLGSLAKYAPAVHVTVRRPLPDDLRLVELPTPRNVTRRELAEALAYRECHAAVLVVSASEGLGRSACRTLKHLEAEVDNVMIAFDVSSTVDVMRLSYDLDAARAFLARTSSRAALVAIDLEALAKTPRGRTCKELDPFLRRQSSGERLLALDDQRELELIGLVSRLQRYLHEHRRALQARPEVAGQRARHLSGFANAVTQAIDASWPVIQEEREVLARMLEHERTKFLMGDTADLLSALVDRVEAQPVADPDSITQLTNVFIKQEIVRWRERLLRIVEDPARLLGYKLEHAIHHVVAARQPHIEEPLPSATVAPGTSCYRFQALALPPTETWRNALRPFRGRAALVDEATRMAVELANHLLARNSRDVIEDLLEMVTLSLQSLVGTLAKSARELAAASSHGAKAVDTFDAIGSPARQSALHLSELLLRRVRNLGRWFTPN